MKTEVVLVVIVGLLILAYILDATVKPLSVALGTPYQFFTSNYYKSYAFTFTSIGIKALAIFLSSLFLISFIPVSKLAKGATLLVVSGLMQLYALQSVVTSTYTMPLEWQLSLTLSGVVLILPAVLYILMGLMKKAHTSILGPDDDDDDEVDYQRDNEPQKTNERSNFWNK